MSLSAPFPYFGGKSGAAELAWSLLGNPDNYVEPFLGSAAMLLARPDAPGIESANDYDGFVANFWRAIVQVPDEVAHHADWPCNETDLFARHGWLAQRSEALRQSLQDPDYYDAKIAGWWVWGLCNWIGSGWCSGTGPWYYDGEKMVSRRQLPHLGNALQQRRAFITDWFIDLQTRLRHVRIACGDWSRVIKDSVTTRHGLTGIFLDPPYDKGAMDYGAGGMGLGISAAVRDWCAENGNNPQLRIALCGHAKEHDALLDHGWSLHAWRARKGYALTMTAMENTASETVWASPHCITQTIAQERLFA